eukprot:352737-Chlamydomonas_euryale.AAC.4
MGIDFGDRASPIVTAAESPWRGRLPGLRLIMQQGRINRLNSVELHSTGRSGRPRCIASFPSHCIAISRRVEPRCTAAVVEWARDPTTAPHAATPQPEDGPDVCLKPSPNGLIFVK